MRHRRIVVLRLDGVPTKNRGGSRLDSLRTFSESTSRRFYRGFGVALSDVFDCDSLSVDGFMRIWDSLGLPLREYFLALVFALPGDIYPIS